MFKLMTSAAATAALALATAGAALAAPAVFTPTASTEAAARVVPASPGVRTIVRYVRTGQQHLRAQKRAQRLREPRLRHAGAQLRTRALTGNLAVAYKGVPAGAVLTTVVAGPSGYRRTLTAAQTLTALRVGTYSLSVAFFKAATPGTARITVSSRYAYVQANRTSTLTVTVAWTPAPVPTPSPTPSPSPSPTPTPSATPTPSPSATPTPTPSATATPSPTPSVTPPPTPTPSSSTIATPTELEVLRLTNEARAASQDCGTYGVKPAVAPLAMENRLVTAARGHAQDMATQNYFSHTSLDGRSPGNRITATGYPWRTWGENIAAGYTTPAAVVAGWIDSDGHCANLMSANFTEIGVGYATNSSSSYRHYWVQNFGRR